MMYQSLFIGNKLIILDEVGSTNTYLQKLILENNNEVEGIVIYTNNQYAGKGQRGNNWCSKAGQNLTFSIFLKPNLLIQNQFLLSKVISLGVIDFLENIGLKGLKIKWPNDIYCGTNKISGILIENSIRANKIYNSIVGIGVNVNQINFDSSICNPTSIVNELNKEVAGLNVLLKELLFFIEKRYLDLKAEKIKLINEAYLQYLYLLNTPKKFRISQNVVKGTIVGVNSIGKLQISISNQIKEFDLKEIEFLR